MRTNKLLINKSYPTITRIIYVITHLYKFVSGFFGGFRHFPRMFIRNVLTLLVALPVVRFEGWRTRTYTRLPYTK